jgi:hypothetical protein
MTIQYAHMPSSLSGAVDPHRAPALDRDGEACEVTLHCCPVSVHCTAEGICLPMASWCGPQCTEGEPVAHLSTVGCIANRR